MEVAQGLIPQELISDLEAAVQAGLDAAERDQAVTAGVSLVAKMQWDADLGTTRADITLKQAKGRKTIAVYRNGQLRMDIG